MKELIQDKRESGVYLSVLGFGIGNYHDTTMKALANHGNGVAAYIDTLEEAHKVMVTEATSSLFPIAKDVKFQVEFNTDVVAEYRLIGYEKRILNQEDFEDDKVDAGDVGSGHTVSAIYELLVTELDADEYGSLLIRYKLPKEDESKLMETKITNATSTAAHEFQFALAVAGFAQILRGSKFIAYTLEECLSLAETNIGVDEYGYRTAFLDLVRVALNICPEC